MTSKLALAVLLMTVVALLTAGGSDRRSAAPDPVADYSAYTAATLRSHFPNVPLVTQDGNKLRFYDDVIRGRVVILQFMFTNCEKYCPMVTPNLVRVQRELQRRGARGITMVSITVDPAHDTPQVLKQYAAKFHVAAGWQFLTGNKSDVDRIRRELGVWDPDEQKVEHLNVLTIGKEATGQWIAIEALATTDDIVQTTLRFVPGATAAAAAHSASPPPEQHHHHLGSK